MPQTCYTPRQVAYSLGVSESSLHDEAEYVAGVRAIRRRMPREAKVVVGGRALRPELVERLRSVIHCLSMQQMTEVAGNPRSPRKALSSKVSGLWKGTAGQA